MLRRTILIACVTVAALIAAADSARCAISENQRRWREDAAPEALTVTVQSVSEEIQTKPVRGFPGCTTTTRELTVTAKVDAVRRTAAGFKKGDVVMFRDTVIATAPCLVVDGSFGEMLRVDDRADVYLRPSETGDKIFLANGVRKYH